jgi:hypothetical protein
MDDHRRSLDDEPTPVSSEVTLERIARELKTIREAVLQAINHENEAEGEIPEKMRRFVTYMHDIHDISYMYEERGHEVPQHILREMERCDDRFRQLIKELHLDGGTFEKVRREMAADPENRWDHTRLLFDRKATP